MSDRIGQQFGNYRLTRLLGVGGFAEVYLGTHVHINTQAAIKILSTQVAVKDMERFQREARNIASLEHTHIVRVLDFGIEGGIPFLVMGYAPHGTLRQRHPKESIVPLDTVLSYVQQVAPALQYAHDRGLIHRDVKPENMLLGNQSEVLLSDLGIAVNIAASTSQQTKTTAGTAVYMAPEQILGKPTVASDQYALAIIVYEWLCGTPPFQGSFMEMCAQHLHAPVPSLRQRNPEISVDVEQCLSKALAKEPEQRFASIQAFATALQEGNQPTYLLSSDSTQLVPPKRSSGVNHYQNAPTSPASSSFISAQDASTYLNPMPTATSPSISVQNASTHINPNVAASPSPTAAQSTPTFRDARGGPPSVTSTTPAFTPQPVPIPPPERKSSKTPLLVASVILLCLLLTTSLFFAFPGVAGKFFTTPTPSSTTSPQANVNVQAAAAAAAQTAVAQANANTQATAQANANATATAAALPPTPYIVNDNNPGITYTSHWGYAPPAPAYSGYYGSDFHWVGVAGESFSYTFTGVSVTLVIATNAPNGTLSCSVDGNFARTISTYSSSIRFQVEFPIVSNLPKGQHTVVCTTITTTTGGVNLDALKINY